MAITKEGDSQSFSYTGGIQTWTCPKDGLYKFTCVGAGGRTTGTGTAYSAARGYAIGGSGGTTVYYKEIKKGTTLYICVGGLGTLGDMGCYGSTSSTTSFSSGYNCSVTSSVPSSWYSNYWSGGGGGATHIATASGLINAVSSSALLCVAGGGGGGSFMSGDWTYAYGSVSITDGRGGNDTAVTSGSYGRSSNAFNGSGYYCSTSTAACYGGSGYVKESSVTFRGTKYTNTLTMGTTGGGPNAGSATILFVKSSFPTVYYSTGGTKTQLTALVYNGTNIENIIYNETTLQ